MGKKKGAASAPHATAPKKSGGWERSTTTESDLAGQRRSRLLLEDSERVRLPGNEVIPNPASGWRVMFVAFLVRGLSLPAHEFLRGLLFVYGVQLHQLTPNSILHIVCFITLCECFLGIHPHWGLWKHIFQVKRQSGKNAVFDVGGFGVSVRSDAEYFDRKMLESAQNWRKKWFYIRDEPGAGQQYGLEKFSADAVVTRKRTWRNELSDAEAAEADKLMAKVRVLRNTPVQEVPVV